MQVEHVFIHKANPEKYLYMDELFEITGPNHIYQSYAGVHDIATIIKIISGYKPARITINCINFHASDIVKFIVNIQIQKYKLSVNRVIFRKDNVRIKTIVLKFRMS